MSCDHEEYTWKGKLLFVGDNGKGDDEAIIKIVCNKCGKKGIERFKCLRREWR